MKHIVSAFVANQPGVLAHIAGLFSARGFNIESLAVGETEDPAYSRMTIVVTGDDTILEQVRKQLQKLINVVKVRDFSQTPYVERDLALIKVKVPAGRRGEILELVNIFRASVVDVGSGKLVIELVGDEEKVQAMIDLLRPYGIVELARTGRIALARSSAE